MFIRNYGLAVYTVGEATGCCGISSLENVIVLPKPGKTSDEDIIHLCKKVSNHILLEACNGITLGADISQIKSSNDQKTADYDTRLFFEAADWRTDGMTVVNNNSGNRIQLWWEYKPGGRRIRNPNYEV